MDDPTHITCDVCIIGAGPAGLSLAAALGVAGIETVVVESGKGNGQENTSDLNAGETTGDADWDLTTSRARAVGGTSTTWTTVRGGRLGAKYIPLNGIDFEARRVTEHSGWPFDRASLDRWYRAAGESCGLPHSDATTQQPVDHQHGLLPFEPGGLTSGQYRWASNDRFTRLIPATLSESANASIVSDATVVGFEAGSGDTISSVTWRSATGATGTVTVQRVVLAAGAIENARLLLVLLEDLGRTPHDWLGRGFMEHPIDRSMILTTKHPALSPHPGSYAFEGQGDRDGLIGSIGLSEELMREQKLRNALLRLFPVRYPFMKRRLRSLSHLMGRTPETVYRVLLDLEQAPHRDNRVTLSPDRDSLGLQRVSVRWQWQESDEKNRQAVLSSVQREFERSRCGQIALRSGQPLESDVHHHSGTTRMSTDPEEGVVDSDLRVHGFENLFVAGSSVFPTAGAANPMLTIVALSLRLADHLTN